ncbi:MAG: hypothetical protein QOE44_2352 [Solirubrobacteraceae bacterium]|nr:hypothetical protein [Solirubrobacteraceae bacterium]
MLERTDMRGAVVVELSDRSGTVVHRQRQGNRIVLSGRRLVADMFAGTGSGGTPTKVTHVGVGTDGTPPADGQTALLAERSPRSPISQVDVQNVVEGQDSDTVQRSRVSLTAVFDFDQANGTEPLREAAVFTADADGVMYNRVLLDSVSKTNAFKLTVLWDIVF